VLFWICIHYNRSNGSRVVPNFEKWNYVDTEELAKPKKGGVSDEGDFIKTAEENLHHTCLRALICESALSTFSRAPKET
jgi:hypothetical protein